MARSAISGIFQTRRTESPANCARYKHPLLTESPNTIPTYVEVAIGRIPNFELLWRKLMRNRRCWDRAAVRVRSKLAGACDPNSFPTFGRCTENLPELAPARRGFLRLCGTLPCCTERSSLPYTLQVDTLHANNLFAGASVVRAAVYLDGGSDWPSEGSFPEVHRAVFSAEICRSISCSRSSKSLRCCCWPACMKTSKAALIAFRASSSCPPSWVRSPSLQSALPRLFCVVAHSSGTRSRVRSCSAAR